MLSFTLNVVLNAFDYLQRKKLVCVFSSERINQFLFFLFYIRHVFILIFVEFKLNKKKENKLNKIFLIFLRISFLECLIISKLLRNEVSRVTFY